MGLSSFERIISHSGKPEMAAFAFFLCWLAAADGEPTAEEAHFLKELLESCAVANEAPELLKLGLAWESSAAHLASEILRVRVAPQEGQKLLCLAVAMAGVDGRLSFHENQILRLLADVLAVGSSGLDAAWNENFGGKAPAPTDPSDPARWGESSARQEQQRQDERRSRVSPKGMNRELALSILGLDNNASSDEVKVRFRKLAHAHHPDRFEALGSEGVAAANTIFRRMTEAYEYLSQ